MGYLTNFIVYTLAMVGVIVIALMVFKTTTNGIGSKSGSKYLKVHDTLSLGPRKTLYIVSAGQEKFLIAGDIDKTTLISKLNAQENVETKSVIEESFKSTLKNYSAKTAHVDKSCLGIKSINTKPYNSVMKNLADKIRQ